jgi:hypothetical protein
MGTCDFLVFITEKYYLIYNHYDSYFSFLENKLLEEIKIIIYCHLIQKNIFKFPDKLVE